MVSIARATASDLERAAAACEAAALEFENDGISRFLGIGSSEAEEWRRIAALLRQEADRKLSGA